VKGVGQATPRPHNSNFSEERYLLRTLTGMA